MKEKNRKETKDNQRAETGKKSNDWKKGSQEKHVDVVMFRRSET